MTKESLYSGIVHKNNVYCSTCGPIVKVKRNTNVKFYYKDQCRPTFTK